MVSLTGQIFGTGEPNDGHDQGHDGLTRGQWPYRPAPKERTMTNRPIIPYNFNFLGIGLKERKKVLPRAGFEPWTSRSKVQHLNH